MVVIWCTFLSGTILLLVVFMNMLIAIMGDTFGAVGAIQEQSALQEQVSLMKDFVTRLQPYKIFENKRYIIRLSPDVSIAPQTTDLSVHIKDLGNSLSKKYDHMHQQLVRRIESLEKNNRAMFKAQAAKNNKLQKLLEDLNSKIPKPESS